MSFFGPALVLMAIFLFIPMILTFVLSFTDYFALNPSLTSFVGLENYISLFKDKLFIQAFKNTILFVIIIVPLQTGLAFLWYFTLYFNGVLLCVFAVLYHLFGAAFYL